MCGLTVMMTVTERVSTITATTSAKTSADKNKKTTKALRREAFICVVQHSYPPICVQDRRYI